MGELIKKQNPEAARGRFIKLWAQPRELQSLARDIVYIDALTIHEVCDGLPRHEDPFDSKTPQVPVVYIRGSGGFGWLEADGTAEALIEEIEDMRAAVATADAAALAAALKPILAPEPRHALTDRGEWTAGEDYVPLDYATKPGTTDTYLCLAENKSSSAGVLSNASFWCPITLPDDGEG